MIRIGDKDNYYTGELGENMSITMDHNGVKHLAGVLLEKYNKIFYHTHSEASSG